MRRPPSSSHAVPTARVPGEVELLGRREDADLAVARRRRRRRSRSGRGRRQRPDAARGGDLGAVEEDAQRVAFGAVLCAENAQKMQCRHASTLRSATSMRPRGPRGLPFVAAHNGGRRRRRSRRCGRGRAARPACPDPRGGEPVGELESLRHPPRPPAVFPVRGRWTGASRTLASAPGGAATCTRARTCSRRPARRWWRSATVAWSRRATTAAAATTSRSGAATRAARSCICTCCAPPALRAGRACANGPARGRGGLHRVVLGRPSPPRGAPRPGHHRSAARPAATAQAPRRPARARRVACAPWIRWSCATASSWRRRCGRRRRPQPLPRMPPGDPSEQLAAFELKLIDMLCAQATADTARDVADKTWDLVHDRPDEDPVKRRVVECHEALARLSARGGGSRFLGCTPGEGPPGAIRRPRQGALDRLPVRGGSVARPAHAGVPALGRGARPRRCRPAASALRDRRGGLGAGGPHARLAHPRGARLRHGDHQPRQLLRRARATLYPILYMWTALYAFYFFPMREALAQMPCSWRSRTRSCSRVQNADMVGRRWLLAVGTPAVAGLLISRLLAGSSTTRSS